MAYRYDLSKEDEVKKYLDNVLVEYQFQCLHDKSPDGCGRLGDYYYQVRPDYEKSAQIHKENCDRTKYSHSCHRYGSFLLTGYGVDIDYREAYKYLTVGCEQKDMRSCYNLGIMTCMKDNKETKEFYDMKKAVNLFEKACANKHTKSCGYLVNMFLRGNEDLPADPKKAFFFAEYACNERGDASSCHSLYYMYRRGKGVEKNIELAKKYKQKANVLANKGAEAYKHQIEMGE